jgi:hypothetical protein
MTAADHQYSFAGIVTSGTAENIGNAVNDDALSCFAFARMPAAPSGF